MLNNYILAMIFGLIISCTLAACKRSERGGFAEDVRFKELPPCKQSEEQLNAERIMLENYSLQGQVSDLKNALEVEKAKKQGSLNMENGIIEAAQKENQRLKFAEQKQTERNQLRTRVRNSHLPISELVSLFSGRDKKEVLDLLGDPNKRNVPKVEGNFYFETWEYNNKIQDRKNVHKRTLRIFFDGDKVHHLDAQ